jgi:hypothetical protein
LLHDLHGPVLLHFSSSFILFSCKMT